MFFAAQNEDPLHSQQKQDLELTVDHEILIVKFRLKLKKTQGKRLGHSDMT